MSRTALVVGAGGAVGEAAIVALAAQGWRVVASMRTRRDDVAARLARQGASLAFHDLRRDRDWTYAADACDALVFATHLEIAVRALEGARIGAPRIVALSSNNVAIHPEAETYRKLAAAEQKLRARFPTAAIIRPTLIYGDPRLPTLTKLVRMARTSAFLPLPGAGRARVQPVFHEDLGRLAAGLAETNEPGVYAAGGAEIVTMRELYDAVIGAAGGRARVLAVPRTLLRIGAPLLGALKLYSVEQAARADHDRLAAQQTPLPPHLAPRVGLREGLARLVAAMD